MDAVSDRVGFGELREEAGGLLVVEVEGVFPERVGDLAGRVEGVAEGDHPLPARVDDVGGMPCAVARGEPDVDAGEDLLALGHVRTCGARALIMSPMLCASGW